MAERVAPSVRVRTALGRERVVSQDNTASNNLTCGLSFGVPRFCVKFFPLKFFPPLVQFNPTFNKAADHSR
jgi:hypothetical protein